MVHAEWPYEGRVSRNKHFDLLIGKLSKDKKRPGAESVGIELKTAPLKEWRNLPESWKNDITKLSVFRRKKRNGIFGLFIYMNEYPRQREWKPVEPKDLKSIHKKSFERLRELCEEHDVTPLMPVWIDREQY